jgi:FtsH-binding integral membrane protein
VNQQSQPEVLRRDLQLRRYRKTAWIYVGVGVLVPVLAAWGAYRGWRLTRLGRQADGVALLVVGIAAFAVRLVLWIGTGRLL